MFHLEISDSGHPGKPIAVTDDKRFVYLMEGEGDTCISDPGVKFFPLPEMDPKKGNRLAILGPSGVGKSYFSVKYVDALMDIYTDFPLYIICADPDDDNYDKLKEAHPRRVKFLSVSKDRAESWSQKTTDDFTGSIVIMDDLMSNPDKELKNIFLRLRDNILENGRKKYVQLICVDHVMFDNLNTKRLLNESSALVMFPGAGTYHPEIFLNKRMSIPPKKCKEILNLRSRWIYIYKCFPFYYIYENGVGIV